MSSNIGFRIYKDFERPDPALVEKFREIPTSNIGDMMNRMYCMHEYIRSINKKNMSGVAFTVKVPAGDNLLLHYALDLAMPGDVIVVDAGSDLNRSVCGEIMFTYAQNRGIAGLVIDGSIRDSSGAKNLDIPIFAKGITPQGPFKNGPGEINVPIACGGQVVFPGDIIVGDPDGVVVIHKEDAPEVVELAIDKNQSEEVILNHYAQGRLNRDEHFSEYHNLLLKKGVPIFKRA